MDTEIKRIRLELARDPQFPEGSSQHGYEITAPLRNDGHIDIESWRRNREQCRVRRFWKGKPDEEGHLVHTRGGRWALHYDIEGSPDDDEVGFRFDSHVFKPSEYISIREHDGSMRTFKVMAVR